MTKDSVEVGGATERSTRFERAGRLVPFLARLALASPYLISAISKLADFQGAVREVRTLLGAGPDELLAALVIATQLSGSIIMLFGGRRAWVGAGLLAGFTVVATFLAHAWWTKSGPTAARDLNAFWEHVAICGGLLLVVWRSREEVCR